MIKKCKQSEVRWTSNWRINLDKFQENWDIKRLIIRAIPVNQISKVNIWTFHSKTFCCLNTKFQHSNDIISIRAWPTLVFHRYVTDLAFSWGTEARVIYLPFPLNLKLNTVERLKRKTLRCCVSGASAQTRTESLLAGNRSYCDRTLPRDRALSPGNRRGESRD